MPSIHSLTLSITRDYPHITLQASSQFQWSADNSEIQYDASQPHAAQQLIHELSHALLDHRQYQTDIELLAMEREAWSYAETLAPTYDVIITDELAQDSLDSYRDWLHARSTCPNCEANGVQTKKQIYKCLSCAHHWRVNDARICALRRYSVTKK